MIFSCTKKVLDKLKKYKTIKLETEPAHLFNWYVDLLVLERKTYFLFTNSENLFSFILYAGTKKEHQNIENLFEQKLRETIIREISSSEDVINKAFPSEENYKFTKTNSRSTLGTMNELKHDAKVILNYNSGKMSKEYDRINHTLPRIIFRSIQYDKPLDRMKEALKTKW